MSLRERIAAQFGVGLNIGEGDASVNAPMKLLDEDPHTAVRTAVTLLDCLHSATRQIFYIAVIRWTEPPLPPGLLEVGVLLPDPANPAAEPVSKMFLFDVRAVNTRPPQSWPAWAFRDPSGIYLPLQIGCLHYHGVDEEGADNPVIGRSFAYGGEGNIKLTAYICAGQTPPGAESDSARLRREFELAEWTVEAIFKAKGWQCHKFTTHTDPDRHVPLSSGWLTPEEENTAVFLGVRNGMLVKVRFTHGINYPQIGMQWLIRDVNEVCAGRTS